MARERLLLVLLGCVCLSVTLTMPLAAQDVEKDVEQEFDSLWDIFLYSDNKQEKLEALNTLDSLPGDYRQFLLGIIYNDSPEGKLAAFRAGIGTRRLSPAEQGQIAEAAMEQGLSYQQANERNAKVLFRLCVEASNKIADLKWNHASPLVIRYFYLVLNEYLSGTASIEHLIEVIDCLALMKNIEAAEAVGMQLGLINAELKKNGLYNEQIVLALVRALGNLGDKSAFDQLIAISYLPYNERIKTAAKAALDKLQ